MDVKSYKARNVQEALALVRRDLGPDAAVLHTREVTGGMLGWLGGRQIEVIATSDDVDIPSRFADFAPDTPPATYTPFQPDHDPRQAFRRDLAATASGGMDLTALNDGAAASGDPLARLIEELLAADWQEPLVREFLNRVQSHALLDGSANEVLLKAHLASQVESELPLCRPIHLSPGQQRTVALVGPTGVGKTTTIAKLAADFRLRQQQRVGLITVDTYRIAAVDQLRTYAEIIDLPMEVVSTPREMREARRRLANLDLLLIDTAGRSPRDAVKLQELRAMLEEARPDEVHLVLSTVASANSLVHTTQQFSGVGTSALLLTKLDEAHGLGNLLPLFRACRLPLSYLAHGQDVPNDIAPAERRPLARLIAGLRAERRYA